MKDKYKIGRRIKVSKKTCAWMKNHLHEVFELPNGELRRRGYPEMLMWAMSDVSPIKGEIIVGKPADDTIVHVYISNSFGATKTYLEKRSLLVSARKWVK